VVQALQDLKNPKSILIQKQSANWIHCLQGILWDSNLK